MVPSAKGLVLLVYHMISYKQYLTDIRDDCVKCVSNSTRKPRAPVPMDEGLGRYQVKEP